MSKYDFDALFKSISEIKIGVIGDVMLDTYWWGKVDRISPEAPVPIVTVSKKEERIGGAGNVALNLKSLESKVHAISVTGEDQDGKLLKDLFVSNGIQTDYIIQSKERITTNKIRIISRNQQMMRLDAEITQNLVDEDEDRLIKVFTKYVEIEKPDLVILEDYNKGVLTQKIIREVIQICKNNGVLTAVDPKRKNFFEYQHVDIFKPNLGEAKSALNIISDASDKQQLEEIHTILHQQLHHDISLITLSEKGIFYQHQDKAHIIPTHIRNIADVSGAGDTVIAVASTVY
ncbi:MAG: carbohydrate kinase, partial [Ferruginibacter sp.]|nr:carbohydrate kinase [Ferruginibacter sp.]